MDNNINIDVYGLSEISSLLIAENILSIIKSFEMLDIRRLHNIIITDELDKELSLDFGSFRNFSDSLAYAKVVIIPTDNDFELVIVIRTDFSINLIEENINSMNHKKYLNALHVLHHELCHVHDYNQRINIFKEKFLQTHPNGKDILLYPLAELCWSEYIANYLSSSSARKCDMPNDIIASFETLLRETKIKIDLEVEIFRTDNDIKSLLSFAKANIAHLIKSSSYVLGYMHGMHTDLSKVNPNLDLYLQGSYFSSSWNFLSDVLANMRRSYPLDWQKESIFENLMYVLDELYARLGIVLSENERRELFFEVPTRGELSSF